MSFGNRIFLAALIAAFLLAAGVLGLVVDTLTHMPDFTQMRRKVEVPIYLSDGTRTTRWVGPQTADWIPISEISNAMLMAVIASEDAAYFQHEGVDYYELKEAIKKDLKEKRWARGASTITQQVVKNTYLGREKTIWRKLKEFIWARQLNKTLSKSEILCFYMNLVEWGPNIYGIKRAASHYFATSPSALTAKQGAFLAMMLPSPVKYHVYFEKRKLTPWATARVAQILHVMHKMKFIDENGYKDALAESLWGELTEMPGDIETLPKDDTDLFDFSKIPSDRGEPDPSQTPMEDSLRLDASPPETVPVD